MGLEMIGLARANIHELWIDPTDYADELVEAVTLLDRSRIHTMIYNHQLCLITGSSGPGRFARSATGRTSTTPSASAAVREHCGGFFFTAKYRMSEHIQAISSEESSSPFEPALLDLPA